MSSSTSSVAHDLGCGPEPLQEVFRDAMSKVATPVTVVTALHRSDPYGTTVSAFASLSMNPAMVVVALDRESDLLRVVQATGRIGVNILGAHQSGLALRFAGKGGARKFDGVPWDLVDELPRLPSAPGWLACQIEELVDGGDHLLALAAVHAAQSVTDRPLVYHGRVFGTHTAIGAGQ